jgi:hypothetical protein
MVRHRFRSPSIPAARTSSLTQVEDGVRSSNGSSPSSNPKPLTTKDQVVDSEPDTHVVDDVPAAPIIVHYQISVLDWRAVTRYLSWRSPRHWGVWLGRLFVLTIGTALVIGAYREGHKSGTGVEAAAFIAVLYLSIVGLNIARRNQGLKRLPDSLAACTFNPVGIRNTSEGRSPFFVDWTSVRRVRETRGMVVFIAGRRVVAVPVRDLSADAPKLVALITSKVGDVKLKTLR